jgi:hypothetical protein
MAQRILRDPLLNIPAPVYYNYTLSEIAKVCFAPKVLP